MRTEILAGVTAAMGQLGLPYAPGTAGPESWACGSLVQSVYGRAGIPLQGVGLPGHYVVKVQFELNELFVEVIPEPATATMAMVMFAAGSTVLGRRRRV